MLSERSERFHVLRANSFLDPT